MSNEKRFACRVDSEDVLCVTFPDAPANPDGCVCFATEQASPGEDVVLGLGQVRELRDLLDAVLGEGRSAPPTLPLRADEWELDIKDHRPPNCDGWWLVQLLPTDPTPLCTRGVRGVWARRKQAAKSEGQSP